MNKNKPIRILHIVGAMNRAGTETMLMNIYRNIDREKIQFDFISYGQQEAHYDKEIENLGGRIIKLSTSKSIKELCKVIKAYGPYEAVHAHTLFNCGIAMVAAKKCGIEKRIAHSHTTLDDSSSLARKVYINSMRFLINKNSTNILACSKEAGKYMFGEEQIKQSKYKYFPNLINYDAILENPIDEVQKFKKDQNLNNGIVIGHIGTFKESKNQKFLLEICKYMNEINIDTKLLLVGDGSLRNELEKLIKEYKIIDKVKLVGTREDISTMLHSMDVFVFPSIFEGLGLVLLEAQAAGLPCIVSEAIQPEADLDMNLVKKIKLDKGVNIWADEIITSVYKKENNINTIKKSFDKREYSTEKCISKLMKIYDIEHKKTSLI